MSFLASAKEFILGAPKAADNILDKDKGILVRTGGFINDLHYSDAEKAKDQAELGKVVIDYAKATANENTDRSKARRSIAVDWIRVQLFLVLLTAVMAPISMELAEFYFKLAVSAVMLSGTGAIFVFFYGMYSYGAHVKKKD